MSACEVSLLGLALVGTVTVAAGLLLILGDREHGQSNADRPGLGRCWEWTGAVNTNGYGVIKVGGRLELAHRVALSLALGRPIAPGTWALHACDNRRCARPRHLREGAPAENVADAISRKRYRGFPLSPRRRSELADDVWGAAS